MILERGFDVKNTEFNTRKYLSLEATQFINVLIILTSLTFKDTILLSL